MNELAILLAAGCGTRLRPITFRIPKPLVKIKGKALIETVIESLKTRGVERYIVVTGYLSSQFEYLLEKYSGIELVNNVEYKNTNNIGSLNLVCELLQKTTSNVFICDSDLYVRDVNMFVADLDHSCYFGKMVYGHSDDWVLDVNDCGKITRVGKVGNDQFNMVGVAWFKNKDAKLLGKLIEKTCRKPGYENMFWDDVVNLNLDKLNLIVHEIKPDQITEIDTIAELAEIEHLYRKN